MVIRTCVAPVDISRSCILSICSGRLPEIFQYSHEDMVHGWVKIMQKNFTRQWIMALIGISPLESSCASSQEEHARIPSSATMFIKHLPWFTIYTKMLLLIIYNGQYSNPQQVLERFNHMFLFIYCNFQNQELKNRDTEGT